MYCHLVRLVIVFCDILASDEQALPRSGSRWWMVNLFLSTHENLRICFLGHVVHRVQTKTKARIAGANKAEDVGCFDGSHSYWWGRAKNFLRKKRKYSLPVLRIHQKVAKGRLVLLACPMVVYEKKRCGHGFSLCKRAPAFEFEWDKIKCARLFKKKTSTLYWPRKFSTLSLQLWCGLLASLSPCV